MLEMFALFFVACFMILKGSEYITDASLVLAKNLRITNVAVGILLVSLMLSLPELVIAISAIARGHPSISIGVSIGSVIINLGLIIGIAAIIKPIRLPRLMISRDLTFMLVATIVVSLIALEDGTLNARDGLIFLLLFIPYALNVYEQEKMLKQRERRDTVERINKALHLFGKLGLPGIELKNGWPVFILGAAALLVGAELLINSLLGLSYSLGLPEMLIALTVGAIGPSIPNLAVALQALGRGKSCENLAISETIGSNIFTLLVTVGIIAMLTPVKLDPLTLIVTAPALLAVTFIFFIFAIKGPIGRREGVLLLLCYAITVMMEYIARIGI